ncbi:trypsin-like peptidase domain-containing protein [Streptomyces sp. GQFP]|uniref:trypsin-like peptidase domain-containing protein n=1 Tax=Streptomyces sp. GQFP TaxID=2907545 RepID=UPI001F227620|nr:trypsin-like peptidase domain-containing protein [Streptomyces sp. GQFP]UIX33241.1 trypsin-like serine protease [Streptomyces sp. GQFP]
MAPDRPFGRVVNTVAGGLLDVGGGVLITRRTVLTARHVVHGLAAERIRFRTGGADLAVTAVQEATGHDIALLTLAEDREGTVAALSTAAQGERWAVPLPNQTAGAHLSGVLSASGRTDFTDQYGNHGRVHQLRVDEGLKNFRGYSGSAVTIPGRGDVVVGILIEQQEEDLDRGPESGGRAASNVLYAVPVEDALAALGLNGTVLRQNPLGGTSHDVFAMAHREYRLLTEAAAEDDLLPEGAALPPLDRFAEAADGLAQTLEAMYGYGWHPAVVLTPTLTLDEWTRLLGRYRATGPGPGFGGVGLSRRMSFGLPAGVVPLQDTGSGRAGIDAPRRPWGLSVVNDSLAPALPGVLALHTEILGPSVRATARLLAGLPGLHNRELDPGEAVRAASPTMGVYLSLQWRRLHQAGEPLDLGSRTLLRDIIPNRFVGRSSGYGCWDDGVRYQETNHMNDRYYVPSCVVIGRGDRKLGLRHVRPTVSRIVAW